MKPFLQFLAGSVVSIAAQAEPVQGELPAQRLSDLRLAVKQSQALGPGRPIGAPRQLSAEERAELRRQVQQQSRRPAKS